MDLCLSYGSNNRYRGNDALEKKQVMLKGFDLNSKNSAHTRSQARCDTTYNGAFNFRDGASQSNEYTYDKNGNMTKDLNKNISSIQYNSLNLPSKVVFSDVKYMDYVYSATGEKRSVTYNVLSSDGSYTYCDNFIYYNGDLNKILVDGGYISISGSTPTYHYYLKDHLGNNRVVADASGTVKQVTHYYPFGGFFGESIGSSYQAYKYNGKEFERLISEDWYDYGARHMDGMRFTTMDPMAEKYYDISPYAYCANNPIKFVDENGDSTRVYVEVNQLGHAWLSVGERDNKVVYSYGRYNGTYKHNSLSNGDGVLLRLTGEKAEEYMDNKKAEGMSTFTIGDVSDNDVMSYVDNIFYSSTKLPDEKSKDYNKNTSARIIDEYELLSNNCTTFVSDVLNGVGSDVLKEIKTIPTSSFGTFSSYETNGRFVNPRSLLKHLNTKSQKSNSHVYKR